MARRKAGTGRLALVWGALKGAGGAGGGEPTSPRVRIVGLASNGERYVAVGEIPEESGVTGRIYFSEGGRDWMLARRLPHRVTDLAFGNGVFVALTSNDGVAGSAYVSSDGLDWQSNEIADEPLQPRFAFGNGVFVATTESGLGPERVLRSADGAHWQMSNAPIQTYGGGVAFSAGVFAMFGHASAVAISESATEWTVVSPLESDGFWSPAVDYVWAVQHGFGASVRLTCCFGEVTPQFRSMASSDGYLWTERTTRGPGLIETDSLCMPRSYPLSVGPTCEDAVPLEGDAARFETSSVLVGEGLFLLGGYGGLLTSSNGFDWQLIALEP